MKWDSFESRYLKAVAGISNILSDRDFVILHKLLPAVVIVDILRFNKDHMLAEHWDVVQKLPEPDYDPMALSSENLTRFKELFK